MVNSQHLQLSQEDAIALVSAWSFIEILKRASIIDMSFDLR